MKTMKTTPSITQNIRMQGRLLTLAAFFLCVSVACGATRTWDGSYSIYWSAAQNWTDGVKPVAGDTLVFPEVAANKVNSNNLGNLSFFQIQFTGSGYTLQGSELTLTNGIDATAAGSVNTVELNINLAASQNFSASSSSATLYVSGDVNLDSYTLTMFGAGSVRLGGVISGTGGITKSTYPSTHWLEGSAVNTYTGPTVVTHGTLMLNKSSGDAIRYGSLIVGNSVGDADTAIVREADDFQIGNIPVTINSDGWLDVDIYSDTVGAITFNGGHAGSAATGELQLGGNVTVNSSATAAILSGKLYLGSGTRSFSVADGPSGFDLQVPAILRGNNLTKTGSGTMALNGANIYTGTTAINQGRLYAFNNSAFGSTAGGTIVGSSGFIQLVGVAIGTEPLTLGRTDSGAVIHCNNPCSWAGDIVLDTDAIISAGNIFDLRGAISGSGGITFNGAGSLLLSGSFNNTYIGPTIVNDGQLLLSKNVKKLAISYGSLTVGDGSGALQSAIAKAMGDAQLGSIPITVNADGLFDLNNCSDKVGNILTLNGGGDVQTGTGTLSLEANAQITVNSISESSTITGNINVGGGACTFNIVDGYLYVSASVAGTANITKTGFGAMSLQSANTFSGTLTVNQSYLAISDDNALGSDAAGTFVNNNAVLGVNGNTHVGGEPLTMNSAYDGALWIASGINSWAGPVTLLRDTAIRVFPANAMELSGQINGAGGLVKLGEGTLALSSSSGNFYNGDTTVEKGVLELNAANVIRYGTLAVGSNDSGQGTDIVRFGSNFPIHSDVDTVINGDGLIDFNNWTDDLGHLLFDRGQIATGSGTLSMLGNLASIQSTSSNWTSTISGKVQLLSSAHTFDIDTATTFNLSANVGGLGGIAKTGGGQLYLTSSNSYAGVTSIGAGRVYVDNDHSLGSGNKGTTVSNGASLVLRFSRNIAKEEVTLSGAGNSSLGALASIYGSSTWGYFVTLAGASRVTTFQAGDSLEFNAAIRGTGDLTLEGGTFIYSGGSANTYTGDTYVNRGRLLLNKLAYNVCFLGDLYIGDGTGGANADVVRLLNTSQIPNRTRITIADSGLFDMNNLAEYFGSLEGSGRVNMGSGTLGTGFDDSSTTFSGLLEGSGKLFKSGSGTFTLTGTNTYTGDTEIDAGTLLVNGSQPGSTVRVFSPGILGGTGVVGAIDNSGAVAPGASAGRLSAATTVMQEESIFKLELDGYAPADYDHLNVGGAVTLYNPNLDITWGFVPAVGDEFTVLENDGADSIVGTFNGLAEGASVVAGNVTLQISYTGGTGNDVVLAATEVAPLEDLAITSFNIVSGSANLEWVGGVPFFVVEKKGSLTNASWTAVTAPTRDFAGSTPVDTTNGFYRIKGGN